MFDKKFSPPLQKEPFLIFLFGLSNSITRFELLSYLSQKYSSITDIKMKSKDRNGKITGYAFLSLFSEEEYLSILKTNKFFLHGRHFFAKPYLKGEDLNKFKNGVKSRRVFVIGIPFSFENSDVKKLLDRFGPLEDAFVVKDYHRGGASKGYGYATFVNENHATIAKKVGKIFLEGFTIKIVAFMRKDEQMVKMDWTEGHRSSYQNETEFNARKEIQPSRRDQGYLTSNSDQIREYGQLGQIAIETGSTSYFPVGISSGIYERKNTKKSNNNNIHFGQQGINLNDYKFGDNYVSKEKSQQENSQERSQFNRQNGGDKQTLPVANLEGHNFQRTVQGFLAGNNVSRLPEPLRYSSQAHKTRRITRRNKDRIRVFTVGGIFIKSMDFNHEQGNLRINAGPEDPLTNDK